jgi:hypothetical protein
VSLSAPTTPYTKVEQIGNFQKELALMELVFTPPLGKFSRTPKTTLAAWTFISSPIQNAQNV